jgi:hypothetical protein
MEINSATIGSVYRLATALSMRMAQLFGEPWVDNSLDRQRISQHVAGFERRLLAWNVRRRRSELQLSQEALCIRSGLDRSYVGRIERLSTSANIDKLDSLAMGLSTTVVGLFDEMDFEDDAEAPKW